MFGRATGTAIASRDAVWLCPGGGAVERSIKGGSRTLERFEENQLRRLMVPARRGILIDLFQGSRRPVRRRADYLPSAARNSASHGSAVPSDGARQSPRGL